ncbi:MAG TPA: hypothetical protein VFI91_07010 [Longimicrobiaceae bacterium]|nr:hypothetical protein [Longimicrobiaceae bacterium]
MRITRLMMALSLIAVLAVSGCASAGAGSATEGDLAVRVVNDIIPPTSLTIWMVPTTGGRDMIGVVPPGATRTLDYNLVTASGEYRIQGETTGGEELWSYPFVLSDSDTLVEWDVSANSITIE